MTRSKRPLTVLILAACWPIITISFLLGLRTDGSLFGIPDWIHDGLKPFGVAAFVIATYWLVLQVRAILLSRRT